MSNLNERNLKLESLACPGCNQKVILYVRKQDFEEWDKGTLIQRAFPYLSNSERERLITGYCDPCWDKIFKEE